MKYHHLALRTGILLAVATFAIILVAVHGPIHQDQTYHIFADHRTILGIPNCLNVLSNALFLVFGIWGFISLNDQSCSGVLMPLRGAYAIFFLGSALVAMGSGYYHIYPSDATLIWDRLPMTISFMAFFSIILGEHISIIVSSYSLWPLLFAGVASVATWSLSGDLRFYILVQFLPILLIPLVLALFPSRLTCIGFIWAALAAYAGAKVLEFYDAPIYSAFIVSGHTLKHVSAAIAVLFLVWAAKKRHIKLIAERGT